MRLKDKFDVVIGAASGIGKGIGLETDDDDNVSWNGLVHAWSGASWVARFLIMCGGAVAAVFMLCWTVFGFGWLGLEPTETLAVFFGATITIGLTIGLMTLLFYSDRSGQDDVARGTTTERNDQ